MIKISTLIMLSITINCIFAVNLPTKITNLPLPTPTPSDQSPSSLWGIFSQNAEQFNIINWAIGSSEFSSYNLTDVGIVYDLISVESNVATIVNYYGEYIQISQVDLTTLDTSVQYELYFDQSGYEPLNSFQYDTTTSTLYALTSATDDEGTPIALLLVFDFANQILSNVTIFYGFPDNPATGVYDSVNQIYYAFVWDQFITPNYYVYAYNSKTGLPIGNGYSFNIPDGIQENFIMYNEQIYAIQENSVQSIVSEVDLQTSTLSLVYEFYSNVDTEFPPVSFNEFILFPTTQGNVTIVNIETAQAKTLSSVISFPGTGVFQIAT